MSYRYAVSDIHGNSKAFLSLLDYVDPDPEELVVCGDIVNIGLDVWGVLNECSQLVDEGTQFVMGNHDYWFMQYLDSKFGFDQFCNVGGNTTLISINLAIKKHGSEYVWEQVNKVTKSMVPYIESDDYIFVHAGLDPHIPYMEDQKLDSLILPPRSWKDPGLDHPFDQTVVYGHTPTVKIHKAIDEDEMRVWYSRKRRKLAIDTGASSFKRLTMVDLVEGIAYYYDMPTDKIDKYEFKHGDTKRKRWS